MIVAYWIVAGLLALVYLAAGIMKVARPKEQLQAAGMAYVEDFGATSVKLTGLVEILGALGLILPALTGIAPWLTVVSAVGLVLVQVGAIVVHVRRGESSKLGINVGLLVLAGVAVWLAAAAIA